MNLRASIPLTACLISLALLSACSSVGRTTTATPKTHSIPHEATATLIVKSATPKPNKFQFEIEQLLRKDLALELVNAGIFKSISNLSDASDYRIYVQIDDILIISGGQRFWLGLLASRSHVEVHVTVREIKSDRIIASFKTTGYGAKTALGAQSYGYDDPVREVVAHVIQNLR